MYHIGEIDRAETDNYLEVKNIAKTQSHVVIW